MDVRRPACWCYPPECANGYEWGPERVIVSWSPCEYAPALAARTRGPGHLVVYCQARGCLAAWYSPRHEPTDSVWVPGAGPAAPPCQAASWRPRISLTASKATRSRRS
jgi:hypothetical protein